MVIDRRRKLAQEPFSVVLGREAARVYFRGRLVATIVGPTVEQIRAARARDDEPAVQLLVARKTGNFKRGNER